MDSERKSIARHFSASAYSSPLLINVLFYHLWICLTNVLVLYLYLYMFILMLGIAYVDLCTSFATGGTDIVFKVLNS